MKFVISPPGPAAPSATITSDAPTFRWNKLKGAATYDCTVSGGGLHLAKSGLTTLSYKFGQALPAERPSQVEGPRQQRRRQGRLEHGRRVHRRAGCPPLTITANDRSKTYGHALALGSSAFATAGLLPGDSVTSVTLSSTGAAAAADVSGSPYAIVPSAALGTGLDKYAITYVDGSLTVNRRALTISGAVASDKFYDGTTTATVVFTGASLQRRDRRRRREARQLRLLGDLRQREHRDGKPVTVTGVTLGAPTPATTW